jgi:hypothetical protein
MTFETPLQPVPARRGRVVGVLVAAVALAAVLVWRPWSASPDPGPAPAGSGVAEASQPATTSTASGPVPTERPTPVPTPYQHPVAATLVGSMPFVAGPTLDQFRPRWGVVGVLDQPDGAVDVRQVAVTPTSGLIEGHAADDICRVAIVGSSLVAVLPAGTMRLFGIAAPASAIAGATELTRMDGTALSVNELAVRPGAGDAPNVAAHLFVQTDTARWAAGTYRFHTEGPDGQPLFVYACLVPPAVLDGSWTAIRP